MKEFCCCCLQIANVPDCLLSMTFSHVSENPAHTVVVFLFNVLLDLSPCILYLRLFLCLAEPCTVLALLGCMVLFCCLLFSLLIVSPPALSSLSLLDCALSYILAVSANFLCLISCLFLFLPLPGSILPCVCVCLSVSVLVHCTLSYILPLLVCANFFNCGLPFYPVSCLPLPVSASSF